MSDYTTSTQGSATVTVLNRAVPRPSWADTDLAPQYWWIFPGSFKDRLGADALAIAASSSDVCKAAAAMLADRQYIDLGGTAVRNLLELMIYTSQPAANSAFPGSGPMTATKRDAILQTPTTEDERVVKGLPEPEAP